MQPDITRLNLGTGDINPIMSSAYNGGNSRSSQYTPRQIAVRDITKDFSDASAGTLRTPGQELFPFLAFMPREMGVARGLKSVCPVLTKL